MGYKDVKFAYKSFFGTILCLYSQHQKAGYFSSEIDREKKLIYELLTMHFLLHLGVSDHQEWKSDDRMLTIGQLCERPY